MRKISSKNISKKILIIFSILFPSLAFANCSYADFEGWKDCFIKEKLSSSSSNSIEVLRSANFLPRVIELDVRQPEKKLSFTEYKNIIKIQNKIKKGKAFYNENRALVHEIAEHYKVEPYVLVALVGLESDFGSNQGKFNIIDSLASLSYEGRRKEFFEKELLNALSIANKEGFEYESFRGSWAGAMGQCQFMPSSYLSYAVDYDNDGIRDIWDSKADALASAANYLKKNGWKQNASQVKLMKVNDKKCKKSSGCNNNDNLKLISVQKDANVSASYAVGKNYDVLMKWNRSSYFVLSVLTIAEKIKLGN